MGHHYRLRIHLTVQSRGISIHQMVIDGFLFRKSARTFAIQSLGYSPIPGGFTFPNLRNLAGLHNNHSGFLLQNTTF
jgi:hypothetical protein